MIYGHLRADCLYTGISSGPNARYRVWESLYLYLLLTCGNYSVPGGTVYRRLYMGRGARQQYIVRSLTWEQ